MRRNEDAYLDDDDMVPDGGSVKVPIYLMDGVQRGIAANSHGQLTDELRQLKAEARDAYIKRTCDAWRTVSRDQKPDEPDNSDDPDNDDDDDDRTRRDRAYLDFKQRLGNAWKRGRTVVGPGPAVAGPGPSVVGAGPTVSGRDAQSIRDAAWNDYKNRFEQRLARPMRAAEEACVKEQRLSAAPD